MRIGNVYKTAGILASLLLSSGLASASTIFSFTGAFSQDDQLETFSFTTGASASVTLRSYGYAGGTNGAATTINAGGFDSFFSVFDSLGNLVVQNNDGVGVPSDPSSGSPFDAAIFAYSLAPDTYTLVLSQFDNIPFGGSLSDGFTRTGQGNFTCPGILGTPGAFCDVTPAQRNGSWAVDISGVLQAADTTSSGVPEPGTVLLVSSAAAAVFCFRRRKSINL
jgi:hypothetical protein